MILSNEGIKKALIRLRGCAGWSAPMLFVNPRRPVFSSRDPYTINQGRRRVFKSGPAGEIIECRWHERGTLSLWGLGGLPRENCEFSALLCAFLMGFYAFGTRFQSRFFLEKTFLGA